MYKAKLQELCQQRSWELPEYSNVKDGPDHIPRFAAAVNVHGQVFETPAQCTSAKEARNTVARIAFDHFNAPSSPPQVHHLPLSPLPSSLPTPPPDTLHMHKNQLQQFTQKKNFGFPVYTTEAEGPPHAPRFKSSVSLDGKSYEPLEFSPTLKEAEQAAAKVACQVLSVNVVQEDGGIYKKFLHELAQKRDLLRPSYETVISGLSHMPSFASTVELGGHTFCGPEAKTKKQAEMNAAKAAYYALMESGQHSRSRVSYISECGVAHSSSYSIQPTATTKKHQHATFEEEAHLQPKRAKSSHENMNVSTHLLGVSQGDSQPVGRL